MPRMINEYAMVWPSALHLCVSRCGAKCCHIARQQASVPYSSLWPLDRYNWDEMVTLSDTTPCRYFVGLVLKRHQFALTLWFGCSHWFYWLVPCDCHMWHHRALLLVWINIESDDGFTAWWHQAITYSNVDLSSMGSFGMHRNYIEYAKNIDWKWMWK